MIRDDGECLVSLLASCIPQHQVHLRQEQRLQWQSASRIRPDQFSALNSHPGSEQGSNRDLYTQSQRGIRHDKLFPPVTSTTMLTSSIETQQVHVAHTTPAPLQPLVLFLFFSSHYRPTNLSHTAKFTRRPSKPPLFLAAASVSLFLACSSPRVGAVLGFLV